MRPSPSPSPNVQVAALIEQISLEKLEQIAGMDKSDKFQLESKIHELVYQQEENGLVLSPEEVEIIGNAEIVLRSDAASPRPVVDARFRLLNNFFTTWLGDSFLTKYLRLQAEVDRGESELQDEERERLAAKLQKLLGVAFERFSSSEILAHICGAKETAGLREEECKSGYNRKLNEEQLDTWTGKCFEAYIYLRKSGIPHFLLVV